MKRDGYLILVDEILEMSIGRPCTWEEEEKLSDNLSAGVWLVNNERFLCQSLIHLTMHILISQVNIDEKYQSKFEYASTVDLRLDLVNYYWHAWHLLTI